MIWQCRQTKYLDKGVDVSDGRYEVRYERRQLVIYNMGQPHTQCTRICSLFITVEVYLVSI
jgi:hypothetical protein